MMHTQTYLCPRMWMPDGDFFFVVEGWEPHGFVGRWNYKIADHMLNQ